MEINNRFIQVRGKIESPGELTMGDDLNVTVTVTSIERVNNDDGTIDEVYKAKLFTA